MSKNQFYDISYISVQILNQGCIFFIFHDLLKNIRGKRWGKRGGNRKFSLYLGKKYHFRKVGGGDGKNINFLDYIHPCPEPRQIKAETMKNIIRHNLYKVRMLIPGHRSRICSVAFRFQDNSSASPRLFDKPQKDGRIKGSRGVYFAFCPFPPRGQKYEFLPLVG